MDKFPVYSSAAGLVDKIESVRAPYDVETGAVALVQADNITIDVTGAIQRRDGFSLLGAGDYKSIFPCGDYGLCVKNGDLCLINNDRTTTIIAASIGSSRVAYARHIDDGVDTIYYSNGSASGKVANKAHSAWTVPAYVGIQSTESKVRGLEPSVPKGHILRFFNGRVYVAKDNMIYPSEKWADSWFDAVNTYAFDSRITMMRFVSSGLYVSTGTQILFLPGNDIDDFGEVKVYDSPAIEGTDVLVPAVDAAIQSVGDVFFFAASGRGICSADNSGVITNHTETSINFPIGNFGAAYINDHKQYVVTIFN